MSQTKHITTTELTFAEILELLKDPQHKAVTLKNKDVSSFLRFLETKKYFTKLYIAYNLTPGFTQFKK